MGSPTRTRRWSYARAGVDRSGVALGLRSLLSKIRYRAPSSHGRPLKLPGHYAGLIRIGRETLAVTTDTVGTKTLLAAEVGRWEEVGEDLVAVNVNDLAAVGARPAALVDTVLCATPSAKVLGAVGRGIDRGLRTAKCSLIGGETAVVPEIVSGFDLGGTALGFFPPGRSPVSGSAIRVGDELVGVRSSGLHANGFTLVRRLLTESSTDLRSRRPGARVPLGVELLRPSRIYTRVAEVAVGLGVTGLAHISGGGVRNLVRLNPRVRFRLDRWPASAGIFGWVARLGSLEPQELYQTFNMGIGFVLAVRPGRTPHLLRALRAAGAPDARLVGEVDYGAGVELPQLGLSYSGYG